MSCCAPQKLLKIGIGGPVPVHCAPGSTPPPGVNLSSMPLIPSPPSYVPHMPPTLLSLKQGSGAHLPNCKFGVKTGCSLQVSHMIMKV
eukprot:1156425-Pelagomonas_calceolata.AAC.3